MTKSTKKKLLNQIAAVAEQAYRRGFQQGHAAAIGAFGKPPSEGEVAEWRFFADPRKSIAPPGTLGSGSQQKHIDRLLAELPGDDPLSEFIAEFQPEPVFNDRK